ncbi:MAG: BrnA antitoxin family protein [Paracoccaceae bacterium]
MKGTGAAPRDELSEDGAPFQPREMTDEAITRAAESDPDNPPLTEADFRRMRPAAEHAELAEILRRHGRPPLPEHERKKRVTMYLDRDVIEALKKGGRGWQTRANATLRAALGLPK